MFFPILQLLGYDSKARFVSEHGYNVCVELANKDVRVVLEPNVDGCMTFLILRTDLLNWVW